MYSCRKLDLVQGPFLVHYDSSKQCRKRFQSTSTSCKAIRDMSSEAVTHPSTNVTHCCLTSVMRQVLITLRHNS